MAAIKKRGSTYKISVSCGYDINGKQIRHHMTWIPTPDMTARQIEKELNRQAILFEEQCRNGQVLDGNIKFIDFAEKWFAEYAEENLRASTVQGYQKLLPRINEELGSRRIGKIKPADLTAFYKKLKSDGAKKNLIMYLRDNWSELLKERNLTQSEISRQSGVSTVQISKAVHGSGLMKKNAEKIAEVLELPVDEVFVMPESGKLSGNTVQHYHRAISSILATAVEWQVIFSNPCDRVETPKAEHKEARVLDEEQVMELIEAANNLPIKRRTFILLALNTGCRRGELCGFEWRDINWKRSTISVVRTSVAIKNKGVITDDTKTAKSRRTIKLSEDMLALLKEYREDQDKQRLALGDQWIDSGRIFTTEFGGRLHPDTASKWYHAFVKKNNLADSCLHSMRHTHASLLAYAGINASALASHLGHSTMQTTMNTYIHAIRSVEDESADIMQTLLHKTDDQKPAS